MQRENDRPGILAEIVLKKTYEFLLYILNHFDQFGRKLILERVHFRGEDSDFLYKF